MTALEPLAEAVSAAWIAYGDETDVVVAAGGYIGVPAAQPRYDVRYVAIDPRQYTGYYDGFANEGLWPLCHAAGVDALFRRGDYADYRAVNQRFADAVCTEAVGQAPAVLVQDYHFALAPAMIRLRRPSSSILTFWHIPWPEPYRAQQCPWMRELIQGLLGSDVVGLQTPQDCQRFIACATRFVRGAEAQGSAVIHKGRTVRVRALPVGVRADAADLLGIPSAEACQAEVSRQIGVLPHVRLGVGIDRLDYSKGIPEKFLAIEHLLEQQPELHGSFSFIQVAEPSRASVPAYQRIQKTVTAIAGRVNRRFARDGWMPIVLHDQHVDAADVHRLYRAADLCYVNSLADGMNLVAKEFVAARKDERGVLLLSEHAGASRQLTDALSVTPGQTQGAAQQLELALRMPFDEQRRRMRAMRAAVCSSDCYWWATQLLEEVRKPWRHVERRTSTVAYGAGVQRLTA